MNYLSIDIGGTYIKYGLIDHSGSFIINWQEKTPSDLLTFKKTLKQTIRQYEKNIKGIAMSCPGRIDTKEKYLHTAGMIDYLYEFPIGAWFATWTNLPFSVVNDGKAAVLAEWWIGNLKGIVNGAALVLGTGVGGGFILNNQLYQGTHFQAGEVSFLLQRNQENPALEIFGMQGSAVGFIEKSTRLLDIDRSDYQSVFATLESNNHSELSDLFQKYCCSIAQTIVNLQVILDLEKIVIGGGISAQPLVIQMIKQQYENLRTALPLLDQTFAPVEIEACAYQNRSNLLGALYQLLLTIEEESESQ